MNGNVTNSSVTINGTPAFGATTRNYGGDAFTGNTLKWGAKTSVKNVKNFENYNFTIPASANPGDTLLALNNTDATSRPAMIAVPPTTERR